VVGVNAVTGHEIGGAKEMPVLLLSWVKADRALDIGDAFRGFSRIDVDQTSSEVCEPGTIGRVQSAIA